MSIYLGQNQLDGGTVVVPESEVRHLLWTNPAPTTEFAAQTLSNLGDLSDYLYVDVEFAPFMDTARCINRFAIGTNSVLFYMYLNTATNSSAATMINGVSRAIQVTSSSIVFGNGQMVYNGNAYVDWPSRAIPTRIWGVTNATAVNNGNAEIAHYSNAMELTASNLSLYLLSGTLTAWGTRIELAYNSDQSIFSISGSIMANITARNGSNGGFKFNLPFLYKGPTREIRCGVVQRQATSEIVLMRLTNNSSEVIIKSTESYNNLSAGDVRFVVFNVTVLNK